MKFWPENSPNFSLTLQAWSCHEVDILHPNATFDCKTFRGHGTEAPTVNEQPKYLDYHFRCRDKNGQHIIWVFG